MKNKCKDCLIKKIKGELCGKFSNQKWLTIHMEREHRNEFDSSLLKKPKTDNVNTENNKRTLLAGCSFSGKTYLMSEIFSRIPPDRNIYIITKSPREQFSNSEIKTKEISDEIKPLNEYENAVIVFDDVLGSPSSKYIDQFFIRGRHNNLDLYYLSQLFFDLPKRTIRNISNKIFLFNQTLKDIENIYRDVGGHDMSYDEFKELCRKSWKEDYNYLCIDRSKKTDQGKYCICNESKNTYINCTPETKHF